MMWDETILAVIITGNAGNGWQRASAFIAGEQIELIAEGAVGGVVAVGAVVWAGRAGEDGGVEIVMI